MKYFDIKKLGALALGLVAFAPSAMAQDKFETTVSADIVNQYIWRGQECGEGSIQPTLGIAYKGFSLTGWGSVGIVNSGDTKEFDLTLAYETGGFHVGVTDYWFSGERYFEYASGKTSHVFEANLGYDFGPVALNWYTNFAGNDARTEKGKRAYSSYFEATAPFKLGGCEWEAALGVVPYATKYYAGHKEYDENGAVLGNQPTGFAVTNVSVKATKDIKITDSFSIPIFAQIVANPSSEKAYFVVGLTLQP